MNQVMIQFWYNSMSCTYQLSRNYLPFTSATLQGVGTAVEEVTTGDLFGSKLCDILSCLSLSSFKEDNLVFLSTVQGMAIVQSSSILYLSSIHSKLYTFLLLKFSHGADRQLLYIDGWNVNTVVLEVQLILKKCSYRGRIRIMTQERKITIKILSIWVSKKC